MKNYFDIAQDYLDKNEEVPSDILCHLTKKENLLLEQMILIQSTLKPAMNTLITKEALIFKKENTSIRKRPQVMKLLYASIAMAAVLAYFPINDFMNTKKLIREDTAQFVNQLFIEEPYMDIMIDIDITETWFESELFVVF